MLPIGGKQAVQSHMLRPCNIRPGAAGKPFDMIGIAHTHQLAAICLPGRTRERLAKHGKPESHPAGLSEWAAMRPMCWSLRFPEGQVSALYVAGARETKTANWPVPETVAAGSKWKLHVFPSVSGGKLNVSSVVTSVLRPSLKILPLLSLRRTAPVQTSYCEVTHGLIGELSLGVEGGTTGVEHGGSQPGAVRGLGVQEGHEPPQRQEFGVGVAVQEVEVEVVVEILHVVVEVLHVVEGEVVVEVLHVVEVLKVVEAGDDVATAWAVKLEEAMAGLEIIVAGKAEVRPRMAKTTVVVDRCMLGSRGWG